jgi:hypothetical protein
MKSRFICLANSRMYNERCVAGVLLNRTEQGNYNFVYENNKPKWIRPVSTREHHEVPSEYVSNINLLDIIEIETIKDCPNGYRTEDVQVKFGSFKKVGRFLPNFSSLSKLLTPNLNMIFDNHGKAVPKSQVRFMNYSLIFIKPEILNWVHVHNNKTQEQLRCEFKFGGYTYNLPVTDLVFEKNYNLNPTLYSQKKNLLFTISLGQEFHEFHYKLIAGVVEYEE